VEGAGRWPAHFVVFDPVHADWADLTGWPYERRRAALEALFTDRQLEAPLTLCPSTTDPAVARGWLEWTAAGLEGLCFKQLDEPYTGGARAWRKYKVRTTTEAVTGSLEAPRTVLLGRYDPAGRLQYAGRSTTLSQRVGRALGDVLVPPQGVHPWQGYVLGRLGNTAHARRRPGGAGSGAGGGCRRRPGRGRTVPPPSPPPPHPHGRGGWAGDAVR
jgi:hypothetical protein